jgi:succinate dehydrogenase/fumarate reductase flavoprotein subunit
VDERGTNSFIAGRTRAFQPGGFAWLVADANLADVTFTDLDGLDGRYVVTDLEAAGIASSGDSIEELAGELGIDVATLGGTIDVWNSVAEGTAVDPWRTGDTTDLPVLSEPPFYAVPVSVSLAKNFGGVSVDLSGRVLDTAGQPIPGVYAAGELAGMCGGSIVGDYGFTGSLSCVVLGGRVAGEAAALEALAR